jgi:predicted DNA-binding ribbon-helix-helix protein
MSEPEASYQAVERVQTGIRLEKRLLKVLKALAEYKDMTLGDLIEGIALHALEGRTAFEEATLAHVRDLKRIYSLDLTASDSHRLTETAAAAAKSVAVARKRKGTP